MPLPSTLTPIATNTLTSATASVAFSNLPQTYTDFVLVSNFTSSTNASVLGVRLNGDSGTNYSRTQLWGNGSTSGNARTTNETYFAAGYWQTGTGNQIQSVVNLMNYSNTTTFKTLLARWNQILGIDNSTTTSVGLWRSTAAVTSITFVASAGNFNSGSSFTIYGIKAA